AGARRGRVRAPVPADLRDRRVPLHLLRLLPGGVSGGGDPRRSALRELRVLPRPLRVRSRAAPRADAPGLHAVGPHRPEGRVMTETVFYIFGAIAVVSAMLCILQRNPVAAAL